MSSHPDKVLRTAYKCFQCGTIRPWGDHHTASSLEEPTLNCEGCSAATRHFFCGPKIFWRSVELDNYGNSQGNGERIVRVSFVPD